MSLLTIVTYPTIGSAQGSFTFSFSYLNASDIDAYVDGVQVFGNNASTNTAVGGNTFTVAFSSSGSNTLTFSPNVPAGSTVRIERNSNLTTKEVDFSDGSVLTEVALDKAFDQVFFASQEAIDATASTIKEAVDGTMDAQNKRIKNVADPVNDQDAVNKRFISTNIPNITTVAGIASDVTAVAGNSSNVNTVATNIANVNTLGGKATELTNVSGKLTEVETVADDLNSGSFTAGTQYDFGSITAASTGQTGSPNGFIVSVYNKLNDVTSVANNLTALQAVSAVSADTTTVAGIASDVTTVSGIASDVTSVAGNATNINTVATDATNIGTNATNINAVNSVANNIANVNTIASNISAINTVNSVASDITTVAADGSDIGTVATNIANVNTVGGISANVTTVAGISSDIAAVVADASDIGAVAALASEIGTVNGISANVTTVAGNTTNINTVAGNNANITAVSGISANVATVAGDTTDIAALAAISSDITSLANAIGTATTYTVTVAGGVFVIDGVANPTLTLTRGSSYIFNLSDSSNATHPLIFKDTSGNSYSTGVTVTGSAGSSGAQVQIDVAANAPSSLVYSCQTHGNSMGNSITVVSSSLATVAANTTSMNTVSTNIANVNSVGGSIANVNSVATNLASVNDFADKYRIGTSDPSSNNDEGDLFYNTATDTLKVYNGSAWEAGVTAGSGVLPLSGGTMTGTLGVTTVDWGDWTITETGGSLYFATSGTNKMKLDASGNLDVAGSVNANATIT